MNVTLSKKKNWLRMDILEDNYTRIHNAFYPNQTKILKILFENKLFGN